MGFVNYEWFIRMPVGLRAWLPGTEFFDDYFNGNFLGVE
jgi:hypothetical protein